MVKFVHYIHGDTSAPPAQSLPGSVDDILQRVQPNELVRSACASVVGLVTDDFFEDILLDTTDISDSCAEKRFKATYPPTDMSTSSFTILKQPTLDINCRTLRSKNSPESFLKIVSNAYSGVQRNEGAGTKLQCNLISQQPDTDSMIINAFEFDSEIEYWSFVGEIKRAISNINTNIKAEEGNQSGYCHFLPSANQGSVDQTAGTAGGARTSTAAPQRAAHRPSGGGGFLGSLFSGQKDAVPRTHRWEVSGSSLVITDTHSQFRVGVAVGAITDTIVGAFDLHDLVALTLSVDYHAPCAALLVASLAHCDRDRDRAKELDCTGVCSSSAYNELLLEVSLQRVREKTAEELAPRSAADSVPAPAVSRCSAVYRRGVGEVAVLPITEEDVLYLEVSDSAAIPPAPSAASTSLSPKSGFGKKAILSPNGSGNSLTSPIAQGVSNAVEVTIRDRTDMTNIVGTHSVSLAELTIDQSSAVRNSTRTSRSLSSARNSLSGAELAIDAAAAQAEANIEAAAKAAASKSPTSMFGFYRTAKPAPPPPPPAAETPASASLTASADSFSRARTAMLGKDLSSPSAPGKPAVPLPRRVGYHDPLFCDVDLALKANLKAARLVIKFASNLPSSSPALEAKGIPPTAYATVYLVDADGEKRSVNSVDSRTEAVKSYDPVWNKEVLLQNEKQGVDNITAVMVLFRDSAVGMLKHHHIGRVNIPFSCFLDNTQADFCLPLEPTYRMDSDEKISLGDVHFTTELIEMGPGNKRVTSIVRATNSGAPQTGAMAAQSAAAAALNASDSDKKPDAGTTSTASAPAGKEESAAPSSAVATSAPQRRMTVIGSTGGKTTRNVAAVRYCLYRASAGGVWWPVRLLRTAVLSNGTPVSAQVVPVTTTPVVPVGGAYGVRNDCTGFLWCGYREIMIELMPGVTGVLFNCQECVDGVLEIPWLNVVDCLDVSEAAVLLTVRINVCTSNATQISKHELIYAPAKITLVVGPCQAAALRRECQQRAQFNFIRENLVELVEVVSGVTSLAAAAPGGTATAAGAGTVSSIPRTRSFTLGRSLTPPPSPATAATNGAAAPSAAPAPGARPVSPAAAAAPTAAQPTLSQLLAGDTTSATAAAAANQPAVYDILPMARSVSITLEGIIQHTETLLNRSLLLSLEGNAPTTTAARGVLTPTLYDVNPPVFNALTADVGNTKKTILQAYSPIVKDRQFLVRTIARAKIYYAFLRAVCGRLVLQSGSLDHALASLLPEYSAEAISRNVKLDCENVQLFTPLRTGAKVETMISRFEHFLEAALERTRDYIIFSGAIWDTKPSAATEQSRRSRPSATGATAGTAAGLTTLTAATSDGEGSGQLTGRECVQLLIETYSRAIQMYVKPFAGSKEAFKKITGQDMKNCILKLLIENNLRFELSAQLALGASMNLKVTPSMPMVEDVNQVMEWYSDCLLHDTRSWLIRTSQNASADRKNKSNLPWDVEMVGDKMVSFLPETLRFQLNVYTELCATTLTSSEYSDKNSKIQSEAGLEIGIGMGMPSGMQAHPTVPVNVALTQSAITERVNEMILHAVTEALVLLADEYIRALQGRHWDRVDAVTGKFAVHLEFLCAVANDCHRVLSRHMTELQQTIKASPEAHKVKHTSLTAVFSEPADIALRNIMRIIFTDVQSSLIDFDTLWVNPKNLLARTLTTAVSAHLRSLRSILTADLFLKLVGCCTQVIVTRFLLFLKARSANRVIMTSDDISRLMRDVGIIRQSITSFLADAAESDDEEDSERADEAPSTRMADGLVISSLDDITQGSAAGIYLTKSSLHALDIMCQLLSTDYDTALFHQTCIAIAEKYENIPAAGAAESKFTPGISSHNLNSVETLTVPGAVLLGCIAPLRSDAGPDLNSFLGAILLSRQHNHPGVSSRTPSVSALSQDMIVKVFGSANGVANGNGNGGAGAQEPDAKSGFKGLLSPGATIKHWREKAADIAIKKGPSIVSAVKSRQNEENAVELMRALGLEGQTRIRVTEETDNVAPPQNARRHSGKDYAGAMAAAGIVPGNNGSNTNENGAARSLHSDLQDDGPGIAFDSAAAEKAKQKKRGSIFSPFAASASAAKADADSSSDSDEGTVSAPQCLIQIDMVQVRGLHSSSFIGGPNPYVTFSVNGKKRVKTSVKWDHKEATWSETKELPTDLQTIQEGRIAIKVFDKERMRRKRLMGGVSVKLAPLEFHSFESWYALEGGEQGNYGEVYCRLRMVNDTSAL